MFPFSHIVPDCRLSFERLRYAQEYAGTARFGPPQAPGFTALNVQETTAMAQASVNPADRL